MSENKLIEPIHARPDLAAIEALVTKATPGPWREDDCNVFCGPLADARMAAIHAKMAGKPYDPAHIKFDAFVASTEQRHPESDADAELICALRNAAPYLLECARITERFRALAQEWRDVDANDDDACDAVASRVMDELFDTFRGTYADGK